MGEKVPYISYLSQKEHKLFFLIWFSNVAVLFQGLYRYAEALYELSFYDEARVVNNRAATVLEQSGDNAKDRDKVHKQRERIRMTEDKENKG
jgi:hypothetical protein